MSSRLWEAFVLVREPGRVIVITFGLTFRSSLLRNLELLMILKSILFFFVPAQKSAFQFHPCILGSSKPVFPRSKSAIECCGVHSRQYRFDLSIHVINRNIWYSVCDMMESFIFWTVLVFILSKSKMIVSSDAFTANTWNSPESN